MQNEKEKFKENFIKKRMKYQKLSVQASLL